MNMKITVRLAGEKYIKTLVVIKSGTLKSVNITVFSSAISKATPLSNISVPTVITIALILMNAITKPCVTPIKVEPESPISIANGAPKGSVNFTTITAHKAALDPIDKSISPAIIQIVNAKPTRPKTANLSRIAKLILWLKKTSILIAKNT